MKGRPIPYSAEELAWLKANCTLWFADYASAFNARFGRDVPAANLHALRKRKGWSTGRTGRFEKGMVPANKGRKCPPGQGGNHPNARRTQFKKGCRLGRASHRHKPIGTERISKDGYRERKVHDGLPMQSRWQAVHVLEWEAVNGPIPAGHCLKCLDGNKQNTAPANWALIPRALMPRLNGGRTGKHLAFDAAAPEVRPILMTVAKLDHEAREKRRARNGGDTPQSRQTTDQERQ